MSEAAATPATLEIEGKRIGLDGLIGASVSTVSSLPRTAVIMLFGLVAPIAAMIIIAGPMRGSIEWGMAFGPIALAATAIPGIIAALIGIAWKRDAAVIGETESRFTTIATCSDSDQAQRISDTINATIAES